MVLFFDSNQKKTTTTTKKREKIKSTNQFDIAHCQQDVIYSNSFKFIASTPSMNKFECEKNSESCLKCNQVLISKKKMFNVTGWIQVRENVLIWLKKSQHQYIYKSKYWWAYTMNELSANAKSPKVNHWFTKQTDTHIDIHTSEIKKRIQQQIVEGCCLYTQSVFNW